MEKVEVSCSDLHVGEELESVFLRATGQGHAAERPSVYTQLPLQHQRLRSLKQRDRSFYKLCLRRCAGFAIHFQIKINKKIKKRGLTLAPSTSPTLAALLISVLKKPTSSLTPP